MTIELRKSSERGHVNHGWLNTYHSFSFSAYYDPNHMKFGPLRVLNEDFVKPGAGFDTHAHQDMEVVSYVLSGSLAHKDSTGGGTVIHAGEVQSITAGTGIAHSEHNASQTDIVHFLQVWFLPDEEALKPGYEQKQLESKGNNKLIPVVSNHKSDYWLYIHQDVTFNVCNLMTDNTVEGEIAEGRVGYLHNAMFGDLQINAIKLSPGDGLKIRGREKLKCKALSDCKFVLFDMKDI